MKSFQELSVFSGCEGKQLKIGHIAEEIFSAVRKVEKTPKVRTFPATLLVDCQKLWETLPGNSTGSPDKLKSTQFC